jgi:hypothetical protein
MDARFENPPVIERGSRTSLCHGNKEKEIKAQLQERIRTMQCCRAGATLLALVLPLALSMGPAYAGERTLEFQLVSKYMDVRPMEAVNVEGQTVTQGKAFGVAVFKDGRIGTKERLRDTRKSAASVIADRAPHR